MASGVVVGAINDVLVGDRVIISVGTAVTGTHPTKAATKNPQAIKRPTIVFIILLYSFVCNLQCLVKNIKPLFQLFFGNDQWRDDQHSMPMRI